MDRAVTASRPPAPAQLAALARMHDAEPPGIPIENPPVRAEMVDYGKVQALEGVELLSALGDLTAAGHHERRYSAASDELFSRVADTDGDDRVLDIYTQQELGPVSERKSAWKQKLSVEHTWPRSKGAKGIAEADLHHLMAADKVANASRSSYPYGEVVGEPEFETDKRAPEISRLGTAANGATVFDPAPSARGNIARGLLYFATRYQDKGGPRVRFDNFAQELPTLLRWNHDDPVDDAERARNDAVAAYQGNRNPYIDHPEFADRVGLDGFRSLTGGR